MQTAATLHAQPLTKLQKLAGLLIILGPDSASELLKSFDERELENISMEMSRLNYISQDMQQEILEEFSDVAVEASTAITGGANFLKSALERSFGAGRASDIIGRVSPSASPMQAMRPILEMDARQLLQLLKNEQPQTIALIASHLTPEKTSQLLELLSPELRDNVIERLATMEPTPVEVIERIVSVLTKKVGLKSARALSQTGGVKSAADVLNSLDKKLCRSVLSDIEKRNPQLGMALREKMFTFEDLTLLPPTALQKLMREVDLRDLALALATANPRLKTLVYSVLSRRAAATVDEEISFLGPIRRREVEAAHARIVNAVRQLEENGEIDIDDLRNSNRDECLV